MKNKTKPKEKILNESLNTRTWRRVKTIVCLAYKNTMMTMTTASIYSNYKEIYL